MRVAKSTGYRTELCDGVAHHVGGHDKAGVEEGVPSGIHGCSRHSAAGAEVEQKLHAYARIIRTSNQHPGQRDQFYSHPLQAQWTLFLLAQAQEPVKAAVIWQAIC